MKRLFCLAAALVFAVGMLSGCEKEPESSAKPNIVCTVFPQYDWTREIMRGLEEEFELELIVDNGTDLHSYQPSVGDVVTVIESDLLITVGGESDVWIGETLGLYPREGRRVIDMLGCVGENAKEEEPIGEEEHHGEEEAPEYDEHVWLSVENARLICGRIAEELSALSPENADRIEKNRALYDEKLSTLSEALEELRETSSGNEIIVADRFPFRYLTDSIGLSYCAAFPGCNTETNASFDTVLRLADRLKMTGQRCLVITESGDERLAKTVAKTAGVRDISVERLSSLQSVSRKQIDEGISYIGAMTENTEALKRILDR